MKVAPLRTRQAWKLYWGGLLSLLTSMQRNPISVEFLSWVQFVPWAVTNAPHLKGGRWLCVQVSYSDVIYIQINMKYPFKREVCFSCGNWRHSPEDGATLYGKISNKWLKEFWLVAIQKFSRVLCFIPVTIKSTWPENVLYIHQMLIYTCDHLNIYIPT